MAHLSTELAQAYIEKKEPNKHEQQWWRIEEAEVEQE